MFDRYHRIMSGEDKDVAAKQQRQRELDYFQKKEKQRPGNYQEKIGKILNAMKIAGD